MSSTCGFVVEVEVEVEVDFRGGRRKAVVEEGGQRGKEGKSVALRG
jgi:hypothetical protein